MSAKEIITAPDAYSNSRWNHTFIETSKGVLQISHLDGEDIVEQYRPVLESMIIE